MHLAIYSPPVLHPCYYGIDMSTREELAAPAFLRPELDRVPPSLEALREIEEQYAQRLSLDSLTYLALPHLRSAFQDACCSACFDGHYPLSVSNEERKWIEKDRKTCYQRELNL